MRFTTKIILTLFTAVAGIIIIDSVNNYVISNGAAAPAGRTGSPGDGGLTCINGCHAGPAATTQTGWITSNIPGTGYVPGNTYNIVATVTRAGHSKFGFEISPQSPTGTYLGTMIDTSTQTQIVSTKYITHTSTGTTGTIGFHTWAFNWTAPVVGTGTVTFYGAFNATNSSNTSSGDTIFLSTLAVSECVRPAQPSAISGSSVVCPGSTQIYSVTNDPTADGYTWTLPSGWTGSSTTNSITVTVGTSSGTISVGAFNNSCGTSTLRTLNVTVNNIQATFTTTNVTCFGLNNGSTTVISTGGSSPYTFAWSNSATTQAISNLSAGTYSVTVTDNIGCTKTASVTITEPTQLLGCSPTSTSVCAGSSVQLPCCSGSGGTPPYSYSWSPSTGLSNTNICNPIATPINSISYSVIISDNNGCTATSMTAITLNPLPPTPVITLSVDTLFANSTGVTFSWSNNGNPLSSGPTSYFIVTQNGNYTVVVTDVNGCTSTSTAYPYFSTSIAENNSPTGFSVNPNPATSKIVVTIPDELSSGVLVVYNIIGNAVMRKNLSEKNTSIDISSLREGVYFASAEKNGRKLMVRFTVTK